MSKNKKLIIVHPWVFGAYPALALLAANINEVAPSVVWRPLMFSLAFVGIVFLAFLAITRKANKAALFTMFIAVLVFSYGHVYEFLKGVDSPEPLGRHRYVVSAYALIFVLGLWTIARLRKTTTLTRALNLFSVALVVMPFLTLSSFFVQQAIGQRSFTPERSAPVYALGEAPPDIYYIILDTYMRGDALQRDMDFDNSEFLNNLREMGFYVADCSQSNYHYTHGSIASSLNLNYIKDVTSENAQTGGPVNVRDLLLYSKTRTLLAEKGYSLFAFQTTFDWSEIKDADIYFTPGRGALGLQTILPFEALFVKSTALVVLMDANLTVVKRMLSPVDNPYEYHIQTQRYILETLPTLAGMPGPKFSFVHIMIPHVPYIFAPDGSIRTDTNYFSEKGAHAINAEYEQDGYVGSVQFVNNQLLPILRTLIADSEQAPIIIIQGDHGLKDDNLLQILNAYYLPGVDASDAFYTSISPVNSFRVVFNNYFSADLPLLEDISYGNNDIIVPNTPACMP